MISCVFSTDPVYTGTIPDGFSTESTTTTEAPVTTTDPDAGIV